MGHIRFNGTSLAETIISDRPEPAAYVAEDYGGYFSMCPHRGWWTETDRQTDICFEAAAMVHGHVDMLGERTLNKTKYI